MAGMRREPSTNRRESNAGYEGPRRSRGMDSVAFGQQRPSVFGRNARLPSIAGPLLSRQTGAALRNNIQGFLSKRQEPKLFIEKCQLWKVPDPIQTETVVNYQKYDKKQSYTFIYSRCDDYEIYCPACDFFFHSNDDYHFHLTQVEQVKPIKRMIIKTKDKIKQMNFEKLQFTKNEDIDNEEDERNSVLVRSSVNRRESTFSQMQTLSKFQLGKQSFGGFGQIKEKEEPKEEKKNVFRLDKKLRRYYNVEIGGDDLKNNKNKLNQLRRELYDLQLEMENIGVKRKLAKIRHSIRKDSLGWGRTKRAISKALKSR